MAVSWRLWKHDMAPFLLRGRPEVGLKTGFTAYSALIATLCAIIAICEWRSWIFSM
ncbi:MAG: hypothetical protein J6L98_01085 [Bacteroidales bacterium]|nr:hypothetical protein [Bacteroidales bacterium]